MSEREFETYLNLLARFLKLSPEQRAAIEKELRAHLEERLEELREKGFSREDAIETALAEFGDAAGLADDFAKATRGPIIRRRIMQTGIGTLAAAAAIALTFTFLLPENRQGVPERPQTLAEDAGEQENVNAEPRDHRAEAGQVVAAERAPAFDALEERVTINVEGATASDAFDQITQQTGVEVRMDGSDAWADPVTLQVNDVSVRVALAELSEQLPTALRVAVRPRFYDVSTSGGDPGLILTVSDVIRMYDVRDLLAAGSEEGRSEALIRLVNAGSIQIRPQIGRDVLETTFVVFDGVLTVRMTPDQHENVEQTLSMLRETVRTRSRAEAHR